MLQLWHVILIPAVPVFVLELEKLAAGMSIVELRISCSGPREVDGNETEVDGNETEVDRNETEADGSECVVNELWTISAIFFLSDIESSMYPSATLEDFHPPCRFNDKRSMPFSAKIVAEVRRNECPVYWSGFFNPRNFAIVFGVLLIVL